MERQQDLWINEDETTLPYLTSTSGRTKAVKNVKLSTILKLSFYLCCWCCKMGLMLLSWYFIFHYRDHRVKNKAEQARDIVLCNNLVQMAFPDSITGIWIFLHNDRQFFWTKSAQTFILNKYLGRAANAYLINYSFN